MNGIHDMGGMQDMGPIRPERTEPVFHAAWEGRIFAISSSLRARRKWNLDAWRYQIELLAPVDYLRLTYYERWLEINEQLLVKHGLVTAEELATGTPDPGSTKAVPARIGAAGRGIPSSHDPTERLLIDPPRFAVGQRVRARNSNPIGHTRLPRYARGRIGTVERDHGVYTFPDTNAHYEGEHRQHVYSVRFSARELWGEQASPRDSVYLDMWDEYLGRA